MAGLSVLNLGECQGLLGVEVIDAASTVTKLLSRFRTGSA